MITGNGLSSVTVKKDKLLDELKKNRTAHADELQIAVEGYHQAVIAELEKMCLLAREGREYRKVVNLAEPEDHLKDYDRVIRMLEMCVHDDIEITEQEFAQYVLDEWGWKGRFVATSMAYKVRG
jgi:hypothetical protein